GRKPHVPHKAPRVHHASRRRGRVAARGACAAGNAAGGGGAGLCAGGPGRANPSCGILSETLARLGWSDGRNVRLDIRIVVHDCYWTVVTVAGEAGVTLVTGLRRTRCLERLGRPAGLAGLELPGLVAHDCY